MKKGEKYLSEPEVCKLLGRSRVTVQRYKRDGLIKPVYRIKNRDFYNMASLSGLIKVENNMDGNNNVDVLKGLMDKIGVDTPEGKAISIAIQLMEEYSKVAKVLANEA